VGCAWRGECPPDSIIVIVDVLCFTTCVSVACRQGATVFPCEWNDARATALGAAETAVVAAKRGERGFTLSPASFTRVPRGLRVVLPSPNGSTLAFAARARDAASVVAGSLRNAAAVAGWASAQQRPVVVVPAGERWPDGGIRFAIEDWLGAGAILARLEGERSAEAEAAVAAYERLRGDLCRALRRCASGRELIGWGYPEDVDLACALDADEVVPLLSGSSFTAVH